MNLNDNIPAQSSAEAANRGDNVKSDQEKLEASLAYRAQAAEHSGGGDGQDLGTAEHRPRRGMIYDAPLGLKF